MASDLADVFTSFGVMIFIYILCADGDSKILFHFWNPDGFFSFWSFWL